VDGGRGRGSQPPNRLIGWISGAFAGFFPGSWIRGLQLSGSTANLSEFAVDLGLKT
jgi:hypothetical protein